MQYILRFEKVSKNCNDVSERLYIVSQSEFESNTPNDLSEQQIVTILQPNRLDKWSIEDIGTKLLGLRTQLPISISPSKLFFSHFAMLLLFIF